MLSTVAEILNHWKGSWLMPSPSFEDTPPQELPFEFDEDGNLQRPRPVQRPPVQLVLDVHLHDVRTYGRDPQKREVFDEAILVEPAAKLPRKVPCSQYDVEGRWACAGSHYIVRGSLSESMLQVEGGSVYRVIFRDDEHCIQEPMWHSSGVGVDVARTAGGSNKPVHIPLVAPHHSPYASLAEEFVSPVTIRLDKSSAAKLHLSFDWRRLYHGIASQPLTATRFPLSRPSLYCVRVTCSDGVPCRDYGTPQFGLRHADQTEAVVFDTEPPTNTEGPHRWRSCLPRSGESLRIASNIVGTISSRWRGLCKSLPVVVAVVGASETTSGGSSSEPFALAGRQLWSPCFDTIERVSSATFDAGIVQGVVRAYWEEDVADCGMSVLCACKESDFQNLLQRKEDDLATQDRYMIPVDDAILSQLLQSNTRCCVINVHMLKKGDSVPGVDDPPVWHPSELRNNGSCPSDTFHCSGSFTSVSMAANGIRTILAM